MDEANIGSDTAILQWTQVDTSPEEVRGFFRGYRVHMTAILNKFFFLNADIFF